MKKIMFSDKCGLTEAVLSGRKTQTRRICRYDRPDSSYDIVFPIFEDKDYDDENNCISPLDGAFGWGTEDGKFTGWNNPKYKIGEVVAVAQSYKDARYDPDKVFYRSIPEVDGYRKELASEQKGWTNKMFVAANLMPHQIRITNVRVERLQDISDEDCMAEGVEKVVECENLYRVAVHHKSSKFSYLSGNTPREAYAALIDKISGKGTFESNPYVFVYDFELVK